MTASISSLVWAPTFRRPMISFSDIWTSSSAVWIFALFNAFLALTLKGTSSSLIDSISGRSSDSLLLSGAVSIIVFDSSSRSWYTILPLCTMLSMAFVISSLLNTPTLRSSKISFWDIWINAPTVWMPPRLNAFVARVPSPRLSIGASWTLGRISLIRFARSSKKLMITSEWAITPFSSWRTSSLILRIADSSVILQFSKSSSFIKPTRARKLLLLSEISKSWI